MQPPKQFSRGPTAKPTPGSSPAMKTVFSPPFYEGCQWAVPASPEVIEGLQTFFAQPDSYPVDGRGLTFTFAFFSPKHLGAGQFYLMTIKDKAGRTFDGSSTYR